LDSSGRYFTANDFERHEAGEALQREIWSLDGVQVVGGSNPLAPTKEIKALQATLVRPFSFRTDFAPTFAPTRQTALAGTRRNSQQGERARRVHCLGGAMVLGSCTGPSAASLRDRLFRSSTAISDCFGVHPSTQIRIGRAEVHSLTRTRTCVGRKRTVSILRQRSLLCNGR
jgi:hypothetical protein